MIRPALMILALAASTPLAAQLVPTPSHENPRLQSVEWLPGETVLITALPDSYVTVMLEPGEIISQAVVSEGYGWDLHIAAETDSFQVRPQYDAVPAKLTVQTNTRIYDFLLESNESLQSAYVVRLLFAQGGFQQSEVSPPPPVAEPLLEATWSYRIRGDRSVRPHSIRDDGTKTVIEYGPDQPLPAVFAIGPSGDEEVVDGYMRDGRFVIDRVHQELVFRIDREKATAKRNRERDERP